MKLVMPEKKRQEFGTKNKEKPAGNKPGALDGKEEKAIERKAEYQTDTGHTDDGFGEE